MVDRRERSRFYQKTIYALALKALGNKCSKCGVNEKLSIHHKDGDVSNFNEDNLVVLCGKCHGESDGRNVAFGRTDGLRRIRSTVYLDGYVWDKFMQICIREGVSASSKIEEFTQSYVERHSSGNPQLRLDKIIEEPILKVCGYCGEKSPTLWLVRYISNRVIPSCKNCIEKAEKKGLIKKIIRLA